MGLLLATRRVLLGGGARYEDKVLGLEPIRYCPQTEDSGTVAYELVEADNGTYARDVATMTTGAGPNGYKTAPLWNPSLNDTNDIYSADLNTDFSGAAGTAFVWVRMNAAARWTDGNLRYIFCIEVNNQNRFRMYKSDVNNRLVYMYEANDVQEIMNHNAVAETGWFCMAMTWDKSVGTGEMRNYYGTPGAVAQTGATQVALGVWAGNLDATKANIGALTNAPVAEHYGWLAHGALWDRALTLAELTTLATI